VQERGPMQVCALRGRTKAAPSLAQWRPCLEQRWPRPRATHTGQASPKPHPAKTGTVAHTTAQPKSQHTAEAQPKSQHTAEAGAAAGAAANQPKPRAVPAQPKPEHTPGTEAAKPKPNGLQAWAKAQAIPLWPQPWPTFAQAPRASGACLSGQAKGICEPPAPCTADPTQGRPYNAAQGPYSRSAWA
jgi:hypothetical protein